MKRTLHAIVGLACGMAMPPPPREARRDPWNRGGPSRPRALLRERWGTAGRFGNGRSVATAGWNEGLTAEGKRLPRNLRRAVARARRVLRASEYEAVHALVRRDGR